MYCRIDIGHTGMGIDTGIDLDNIGIEICQFGIKIFYQKLLHL